MKNYLCLDKSSKAKLLFLRFIKIIKKIHTKKKVFLKLSFSKKKGLVLHSKSWRLMVAGGSLNIEEIRLFEITAEPLSAFKHKENCCYNFVTS